MSSLIFLLVWDPVLHTPYISAPNHHHLFATHVCPYHCSLCCCSTNVTSPITNHSLRSLLGNLSFTLMPHIHLTILISARWSATTFSFLTGQVSLPCNILFKNRTYSECDRDGIWTEGRPECRTLQACAIQQTQEWSELSAHTNNFTRLLFVLQLS